MRGVSVTFNGTNLATAISGLIVTELPYRPPSRQVNAYPLANADRKSIVSAYYNDRKINVMLEIGAAGKIELDDAIDTLNQILAPKEKTLRIEYGSGFRDYTATFANMSIARQLGGFAQIELEFTCSDSMGYATSDTTIVTHAANVAAYKEYYFQLGGSAEFQLPVITVTVNSLLGGTGKYIKIGNLEFGQVITVTRNWSAADVLVVDCVNKTVKVNGAEVDFSGAFPEFQLPDGTLTYEDNISHRNTTIGAVYRKRYI